MHKSINYGPLNLLIYLTEPYNSGREVDSSTQVLDSLTTIVGVGSGHCKQRRTENHGNQCFGIAQAKLLNSHITN